MPKPACLLLDSDEVRQALDRYVDLVFPAALVLLAGLVFPFRKESLKALQWAVDNGGSWQSRYLLALLKDFLGNRDAVADLLKGDASGYAPYYAYRYQFSRDAVDLEKAIALDPQGWRYIKMLAADKASRGDVDDAAVMLERFYSAHPDNVQIDKYRKIKLHLSAAAADAGDFAKAEKLLDEALMWPERLGVGKPYDDMIDTSVEDRLRGEINSRKNGKGPFEPLSSKLGLSLTKDKKLF